MTAAGGVVAVSAGAGAGRLAKTTAKPMRVTTASKAMNPSNTQVSVGSDLAPVDGVLRIISNGQPVIDPQRLAISVQQLWQAGFHKSNGSLFARPKHNQYGSKTHILPDGAWQIRPIGQSNKLDPLKGAILLTQRSNF
ncbi:MAG: hypothetical protein KA764_07850 [Anaerolineales bacterium]|nr:hypothetical protein [Anaerolineales bacterium]